MEEWKICKNYTNYSCSNLSRIKNNNTGRILKMHVHPDGYCYTNVVSDGKSKSVSTHRLIAENWIPNPETNQP